MPEITMLEAIRQALFEEMDRDPAVVAIGEDIGVYGGAFKATEGLLARFGHERVIETPISETAIVGAACGMSYLGLRPVVEMQFIDFIACCFNQVTNFVAKSHYRYGAPVPMVLRGPSGGGTHGGPFHSANPEMYFVHTPGLKVVYPSTAYDAKGLLKSAIRDNNPVLFFEHKFLYRRVKEEIPGDDYTVPISNNCELRGDGARRARRRCHASERRHRSRSDRSANFTAARQRNHPRLREKDEPALDRA
jgi:2-oxoisovalerate dehydrogenase E1 component beta subunit